MNGRARLSVACVVSLLAGLVLHFAGSGSLAAPPLGSWAALEEWYASAVPAPPSWRWSDSALSSPAPGCASPAVCSSWPHRPGRVESRRWPTRAARASSARWRTVRRGSRSPQASRCRSLPGGAVDNPPGTAVMVPLDVTPSTTTTSTRRRPRRTTVDPTADHDHHCSAAARRPSGGGRSAASTDASRAEEVVVAPGDSFWSIAVDEAGDRDLVSYWRALIEVNRDRLVDPLEPRSPLSRTRCSVLP